LLKTENIKSLLFFLKQTGIKAMFSGLKASPPSYLSEAVMSIVCSVVSVGDHLGFTGCSVETAQEENLNTTPPLEAIDITPNQDGGVLKEITRAGVGSERPLVGDRVSVHYDAMLASGQRVDSSRFRGEAGFEFQLGKGQCV
jgi:FKBP-type peptidyl-prolyl cis-trans isomerase